MAEIKSTLEMVLARADAMCADAPDTPDDTLLNSGMKFAGSFVSDPSTSISKEIDGLSQDATPVFLKGMLKTFFRYVSIPRDDSQTWKNALKGIQEVASFSTSAVPTEIPNILTELNSLLGRYSEHRAQLENQLKESFAMQAAQLSQSMAQQTGMKMDISPEQHPKYNEEWGKALSQLNEQYLNAIDQYKNALEQIFNSFN